MTKQMIKYLPASLQSTQEWFAKVITTPLQEDDSIRPYSPNGFLIAEEAARYIAPSPTLDPHQRIQIYNQQYWWRLLNTLHTNFPLTVRLFGYQAFNETIGIPYLTCYPPNHWSLILLGERLPQWIDKHYHELDRTLIQNAVDLDWAFTASFMAPQCPPLDLNMLIKEDPNHLLTCTFYLQPHIHLFKWDYDLFAFRDKFLKEDVSYWVEHPFPALPKDKIYHFALYRTLTNIHAWIGISEAEHFLLQLFKNGSTIEEACDKIESQESALYDEVATHLEKWIQTWTRLGWLTLKD